MTEEQVFKMLESMQDEIKTLSSKKHDAKLSRLKVKMVNKLIGAARELLSSETVLEYLEEFDDEIDDEILPQYSDVVIILRQYIDALTELRNGRIEITKALSDDELKQIEEIYSNAQSRLSKQ